MATLTLTFSAPTSRQLADLHARFLTVLPAIESHARIHFRDLKCLHRKADAVQEMRALGWRWFVRLAQRGRNANDFIFTFTRLLARAVRAGRRLAGMERVNGVLNQIAQGRHGFTISPLPEDNPLIDNVLVEALHDNTQSPVPDQVAFRLDFPGWRRTRTARDRKIIGQLMSGERSENVAKRFALTPGRVAQLRREFHTDWERFCRLPEVTASPASA